MFEVPGDGEGEGPDFGSEEFQAAEEACREHLEGAGIGPGNAPPLSEDAEQAMLDFARCMREHGIDMPDPGEGGLISRVGADGELDPRSEEFQEAQEACRQHLEGLPQPDAAEGDQP